MTSILYRYILSELFTHKTSQSKRNLFRKATFRHQFQRIEYKHGTGPCVDGVWLDSKAVVQSLSCVQLFAATWTIACNLHCPWDFPGKNTRMGCHFLLQGIFLIQTQRLNSSLLHWQDLIGRFFTAEPPAKPILVLSSTKINR